MDTSKKNLTCCFTGHRKIPQEIYRQIEKCLECEIEKLILKGVIYYGSGGALGFDTLCATTILKLRKKYPKIKLILVLPCNEQTKGWNCCDVRRYEYIKSQADKVVILSKSYYRGCMHTRNRHLVDNSAYCICYLTKSTGGTAYTVEYAESHGLTIFNIIGRLHK